ncbi:hypothetical protein OF83DRAFT_1173403 [Amylostereum chailletii]|nr:hypothetical protein OF83DRAFT_1173403 [Amylostereum chailletii]
MESSPSVARDYWSNAVRPRLAFLDSFVGSQRALKHISTDPRRVLDIELAALDAAASHIRFRQNALSPVGSLPPEILAAVFQLYVSQFRFAEATEAISRRSTAPRKMLHNSHIAWVASLTHVCRHWRSVALNCRTLWQTVDFSMDPQWWREMIIRSNPAPLILAMSEKHLREADILIAHLHRIEELDLVHCSSIQTIVDLCIPSPNLRALSVSASNGEGEYVSLSEALFPGDTPKLRKVILRYCFFPWTSSLFKNLAYLEITFGNVWHPSLASILFDELGPFVQFLDAISAMPTLETLILKNCLFFNSTDVETDHPIISLPSLTKFEFSGSVTHCVALLAHLEISSCIMFSVALHDRDETGNHGDAVLSYLSAAILRVQNMGKIIRSIVVEYANSVLLTKAYEERVEGDPRAFGGDPVIQIYIDDLAMPEDEAVEEDLVQKTLGLFPLDAVTNLCFTGNIFYKDEWAWLFDDATQLSSIFAMNAAAESLIPALNHTIPLPAGPTTSADATVLYRPVFPHLRTLWLESANLADCGLESIDELGVELLHSLQARRGIVDTLILRDCKLSLAAERALLRAEHFRLDIQPSSGQILE